MNPKFKRFLQYFGLTVLFVAIGYAMILIAGAGLLRMVNDEVSMAVTKGAPDYPNGFDKHLYDKAVQNGNVEEWSEVPLPALHTSYAELECEQRQLKADVFYGDDEQDFSKGVGQYVGSGMFGCGKPILIGGHDSTYFAELEHVAVGDVITVRTNYGSYTYTITSTKIAKATDDSAYDLDQEREELILYTCYPFGDVTSNRAQRYFVYALRSDNGPVIKQESKDKLVSMDAYSKDSEEVGVGE